MSRVKLICDDIIIVDDEVDEFEGKITGGRLTFSATTVHQRDYSAIEGPTGTPCEQLSTAGHAPTPATENGQLMRARVTVDGQTRLDNELDEWHKTTTPPPFIAELIKPGHKPEPYLIAAAMALAEAAKQGNPITITINTDIHPSGWTMNVQHAYTITTVTP